MQNYVCLKVHLLQTGAHFIISVIYFITTSGFTFPLPELFQNEEARAYEATAIQFSSTKNIANI
jgi:HKD family nuclease